MINEATLIGRIGKKDVRTLKNGAEMATIYLATSRKWTDTEGRPQEHTTWHNVNFFNKLADIVKKYAHVGELVYIKGEINNKQITHGEKEGQWAYSITASQIKLLPSGSKKNTEQKAKTQKDVDDPMDFSGDLDDEIPF